MTDTKGGRATSSAPLSPQRPALKAAALHYATEFAWPVFPLVPREKRPLTGHGFKDATTDTEVIERWWGEKPDANIGLPCINFDVLDVDGDEGWRSLSRSIHEAECCLPSAPLSSTPGGGAHYFFEPSGVGNKAGFLPSLDWRGDSAGYVVAPPSIGSNGRRYRWEMAPNRWPLQSVPAWLVKLLDRQPAVFAAVKCSAPGGATSYGRRALEGEVGRVILAPEGQRNHMLNQAAFSLAQLVAAGKLDADTVAAELYTAGVRVGLGHKECVATVRSGMEAGAKQPRSAA